MFADSVVKSPLAASGAELPVPPAAGANVASVAPELPELPEIAGASPDPEEDSPELGAEPLPPTAASPLPLEPSLEVPEESLVAGALVFDVLSEGADVSDDCEPEPPSDELELSLGSPSGIGASGRSGSLLSMFSQSWEVLFLSDGSL